MRGLTLILAGAVLAAAAPPPANDKPAPTSARVPDDQKQICRRETPIGTIRTVKICMTKKEWKERAEQDENDVDRLRRSASSRTLGSTNQ